MGSTRVDRSNIANMLVSELERLLEAQLQNAHHELLVRVVVDNLANKSWMINSDAMRACLDLHLSFFSLNPLQH